ncbi:hypothetical protein GRI40_04240 [Altererythrobacter aerius]|uniref:DUF1269 domain-containing protein n=1 Tax=Tsuneonella aeria TaxID=1837929 RepID=A0A6I4TBL0_9SPHN|nr:hypothetical protein [Tsuneonella aeria]MXO74433.1 hypothetical protein [Tsuneonella aeria]
MTQEVDRLASFVVRAEDLAALNHLRTGHPRPRRLTWINRGTDQELRPTTVQMLLRTLFRGGASPSVSKLHREAGLRLTFDEAAARDEFARCFSQAFAVEKCKRRQEVTAIFERPEAAERAFRQLTASGVSARAISLLWRAGQYLESNPDEPRGHSRLSVAAASAGGGLAGAIFGVTLLTIPGVGLIAAGGAIAAQAAAVMGAFGGAMGATGGAFARMLTDLDVEDRAVDYYEAAVTRGKVFVSVDPAASHVDIATVHQLLEQAGGRFAEGERRSRPRGAAA